MFTSPTYGKMDVREIPERIQRFYDKNKQFDTPIHIIIGTDSQNFDFTKIVSVVAVVCE